MREKLEEKFGKDLWVLEGFDKAIIGFDEKSQKVIYSIDKIVKIIQVESMNTDHILTQEEAFEHFAFNIQSANCGDKTPILCYDIF